ncbi:type II toxin-antitoxin system VapC family toxin [Hymenobacter gummosus]|nr:type II toxin-antitoxin system VapC family toxin [Hymenobacter gummosus]
MIAVTAVEYDLTLLTRNLADFTKITGLTIIDPLSLS